MNIYEGGKKDKRIREYLPPQRILWQSDGSSRPENAQVLLENTEIQAYVSTASPCLLKPGGALLLDFGIELHGGVRIVLGKCAESTLDVRLRFGESVSEAMSAPNNDHAIHDSIVKLARFGMTEFGNTGFRFLRIDIPADCSSPEIELLGINAVAVYRKVNYVGAFKSNDARLNQIWRTGAYTVHLNMQDYIYDGIKRDRLVWIGDLHPETKVICSVFDDLELVPASLDFVRERTNLPGFMNNISSYSLWWIINQHDWFWHSGDINYLKKQSDYLFELLTLMSEHIDIHGCEQLPEERFLDWRSVGRPEVVHSGLQGLLLWAFKAGKYLCSILGNSTIENLCISVINKMYKYIPERVESKPAEAFKVIAGICSAEETNRNVFMHNEYSGMSPFMGYYVLQAKAMAGDYAGAMRVIDKFWGGMLDFGATSFWEDFEMEWTVNAFGIDQLPVSGKNDIHADFGNHCYKGLRHSLCHGWSGGPTAWLSEHVLGVKVLSPGAEVVQVNPQLGYLESVEGSFATVKGPISIKAKKIDEHKIDLEVSASAGVNVVSNTEVLV